jgi:hypothetical protein
MEIALAGDKCAILFDSDTGCLLGIRDLERRVDLLDPGAGPRVPFRLHGFPTPVLADLRMAPPSGGSILRAHYEAGCLSAVLRVSIPRLSAQSSWSLEIRNRSADAQQVSVDFPFLAATGSALFVPRPGCPLQWACVAAPSARAGLGVVVHDPSAEEKLFLAADGTFAVNYAHPLELSAGRSARLPETILLTSPPEWRDTARVHGAWRGSARIAARAAAAPAGQGQAAPAGCTGAPVRELLLALRLSLPGAALRAGDPVDASLAGVEFDPETEGRPRPACLDSVAQAARAHLSRNWACASDTPGQALLHGEVLADPRPSDPGVVARMFRGADLDAAVFARPPDADDEGLLGGCHAPYEVAVPVRGDEVPEVALCDLEDLSWQRHVPFVREGCIRVDASSNWMLCLVLGRKTRLVGFEAPPEIAPGGKAVIRLERIAGTGRAGRLLFSAGGLLPPRPMEEGSEIEIPVPPGTAPGFYRLALWGRHVPRFSRMLHVLG